MTVSTEITWLAATVLLTGVLWIPYIVNRIVEHGLMPALRNPRPDAPPLAGWADRLMHAHSNAVENLVLFAPLVLAVEQLGLNSATTAVAVQVYFWARLAHAAIYTLGVPYLRTIAFAVGFVVQVVLANLLLS